MLNLLKLWLFQCKYDLFILNNKVFKLSIDTYILHFGEIIYGNGN